MKVLLINPPDPNSLDPRLESPLGLMYLSAILNKCNFETSILDLAFYDKSQWRSVIESSEADLYGMTVYSSSLYEADAISKLIKSYHPDSKIIWGGPHPTFCINDVITQFPEVDFIAIGEGEGTLLELCENFGNPASYSQIRGLCSRNGQFFYVSNIRPLIKDIDLIPPPDRQRVDLSKYTRKVDGIPSTPMMTSRGCAYSCKFCDSKFFWHHPRFHSINRFTTELDSIREDHGFNSVHFWDDTFTLHPELPSMLDYLRYYNFTFRCNGDLRLNKKKTLQKLYDSGCREIGFGIESGDQKVLDYIGKRTNVEQNKKVLRWCKEIGLPVKAYLMVGNPSETWDSVEKTIDFIKETGPELYTLSSFTPLPGSEFFHHAKQYKINFRTKDWSEFFNIGRQNEGGKTHDTEFMTAEEIQDARKYILMNLPKQTGKTQEYYTKVKHD